jgi:hypothetical protein
MNAENVAKGLGGRKAGGGWVARCPAHDDREPSLSISDSDNGKVLVRCHAGCDQVQVIAELRLRGLWYERIIRTPLYSWPTSPSLSAEREPAVNRRRARALMAGPKADRRHDRRKLSRETWSSPRIQQNRCNRATFSPILSLRQITVPVPAGFDERCAHQ